jgi:hypothetical protein
MCRKCVKDYLDVRTYYHALEHSEMDGINCKELLTSQDRVEIVSVTYAFIVGNTGLWSKGYCSTCFTTPLNHSSQLTKTTNEFFALSDTVRDCFDEHPNASTSGSSDACTACQGDYWALNKFYRERIFQAQFPVLDGICFDILDMMNNTQRWWGRDYYGCGRKMTTSVPLWTAMISVLLTPVLFYVGMWWLQKPAVERAVVQPHITDLICAEDMTDHRGQGFTEAHNRVDAQDRVDGWNGHEHGWEDH